MICVTCVRSDYVLLREHFKKAHILCEEGECRDTEFTNVFRSDIDYRAHWTQKHSAGVGRQQARQMRQIDISVDFGSSAGDGRGGRGYHHHQRGLFAPIMLSGVSDIYSELPGRTTSPT